MAINPARLSDQFRDLFPCGVVAAELRGSADPELLLEAELVYLGRAVPKRIQEFTAGRLCARLALSEFGVRDFPIRAAVDRQPIWPENFVGSISHTGGMCAAVVAERRRFIGLGVDVEIVGDVTEEIWPSICLPAEAARVNSLPHVERAAAIALIFSAKEAFYKAQFPVVREWLNFQDLHTELEAWAHGNIGGEIMLCPTRPLAIAEHVVLPIRARYRYHEKFVSVGVALRSRSNDSTSS